MMKSSINTIFFDVGDVLVVDFINRKYEDLAKKYHLDLNSLRQTRGKYRRRADLGEFSDPEFWQLCLKEMGVEAKPDDWEVDSYYEEMPGSREIVLQLQIKGYRLAIISDDSHEMANLRRQRYGYDGLFEQVIISSDHGIGKPDAAIFQLALREMKVAAEASLFIDNLASNLAGAEKVNMHTLLFTNADKLKSDLVMLGLLSQPKG